MRMEDKMIIIDPLSLLRNMHLSLKSHWVTIQTIGTRKATKKTEQLEKRSNRGSPTSMETTTVWGRWWLSAPFAFVLCLPLLHSP